MSVSFKKTKEQQLKLTRILVAVGLFALFISIWHLFSIHGQTPEVTAANYENVIQAHIMTFKLKVAAGLFALGSLASYGLTHAITHSPLGRWMFEWKEGKDDSNSKAAKVLSLGLVFAGSLVGVFTLLANVIGK